MVAGAESGNSKLTAELVLSSPLTSLATAACISKDDTVLAGRNTFSAA